MPAPVTPAPDAIFDTALLRRRLARAIARGPADFLLARAAEDIAERLETVQRAFVRIADIGTPGPHLAQALAVRWPEAWVTRVGPYPPLRSEAQRGRGTARRVVEGAAAASDPNEQSELSADTLSGGSPLHHAPHGPPPPLRGGGFAVGDAERLPLADGSLDLAVSALALQTANDLPGALVQIRRALKPDGLFLGALLGGRTLHELRTVLTEADVAVSGGASPRVAPFADVRDMGGLLQRAGFALPVADSDVVTVRYPHLFALMADLRAMGATSALQARTRRPTRRDFFLRAAALYQKRFADPDGRIRATFEIVSVSGWAPHESQQKPAKRGSAQISLAAVLGDKARERDGIE